MKVTNANKTIGIIVIFSQFLFLENHGDLVGLFISSINVYLSIRLEASLPLKSFLVVLAYMVNQYNIVKLNKIKFKKIFKNAKKKKKKEKLTCVISQPATVFMNWKQ